MKVSTLMLLLSTFDPDADVILQKDAEGNGYTDCHGAKPAIVHRKYGRLIEEVYDPEWTAEDAGLDEDEWHEILETHKRSVVIFP